MAILRGKWCPGADLVPYVCTS